MTYTVSKFASATYGRAHGDRPNTYFSVQQEGAAQPVALIPSTDVAYGTTTAAIAQAFVRARDTLGAAATADAISRTACAALRPAKKLAL